MQALLTMRRHLPELLGQTQPERVGHVAVIECIAASIHFKNVIAITNFMGEQFVLDASCGSLEVDVMVSCASSKCRSGAALL